MDCIRVGRLIYDLRKEKNMTQKQLADTMNISDKAISKWERGLGCPDVSLLGQLSQLLGVHIEKILLGELESNAADGGSMKRIKFYVCQNCGNTLNATGEAEVSCCGRKLSPLIPKPVDEIHKLNVENIEDDLYITFTHEMEKTHFLSFVAYVAYDKMLLVRLYPEQCGEVRFPKMYGGKLFFHCSQHGLWAND